MTMKRAATSATMLLLIVVGCTSKSGSPSGLRVFVSSAGYQGAIDPNGTSPDGVAAGDQACANLAQAAGLGSNWRAWLSGFNQGVQENPIDRVTGSGPWMLVDGVTTVFASKAAMTSSPQHAIDKDEKGNPVAPNTLVWTATLSDGTYSQQTFCNSWTSLSSGNTGGVGKVGPVAEWTASQSPATDECDHPNRLYCFQVTSAAN
jgi:hypothetical protein